MYNKDFFERQDISTVSNNYLLNQTRIRYCYYYNHFSPDTSLFGLEFYIGTFINAGNIYQKACELMDESLCKIVSVLEVFLNANEISEELIKEFTEGKELSYKEQEQARIAICIGKMQEKENKYLNEKEDLILYDFENNYLSKEYCDISHFSLDNLDFKKFSYTTIKEEIKKYLKENLKDINIKVPHYDNDCADYLFINNMIDDFVEALAIDIMSCFYTLSTQEECKTISSLSETIFDNIADIISATKKNTDNFRKKYNHFTAEGIFELFKHKYLDEKKNNRFSPYFDSEFLYYLINGDISLMESCASKDSYIKTSIGEKIKKMKELSNRSPIIQYHIEQHFMMYSLYYMNRRLGKTEDNTQNVFECSELYDIPFPLLRIEIAKSLFYNSKKTYKGEKYLSLIDFKYYVYQLAKNTYDELVAFIERHSKTANSVANSIYEGDFGLEEDIVSFMRKKKIVQYSECTFDIFCILAYNKNGKNVQHSFDEFHKDFIKYTKNKK